MQQYLQFIPWLIALGSLIVAYKSYSHNVSKDSVTKIDNIKDGLFKANMKLDTVDSEAQVQKFSVVSTSPLLSPESLELTMQ